MEDLGVSLTHGYDNPSDPIDTVADLCVVSGVGFIPNVKLEPNQFQYDVYDFNNHPNQEIWLKCERSWKYFKPTGVKQDITPRDAAAVAAFEA